MKYTYLLYGLIVQSDIQMYELMPYYGKCARDVTIDCIQMPEHIKKTLKEGKKHCFEKNQIWFSITGVATYYIKDTNNIQVEIFKGADEQSVKTFLLGSAFGMLLIKRNSIAIHGGAVVIDGQGIIITGDSGAGKSTLTAALRENGCPFLADDVSVISEDKNIALMIMPGYPQQKLCRDATLKFKYSNVKKIPDGRDKYSIAVENEFRKIPAKLKAIYELRAADVENVEFNQVTGAEKLNIIFKNIFRFELISFIGMKPEYFKKCVQLAKDIEIYKIIRPEQGDTIDRQLEIIEATTVGVM